jgi:(2Fe-2S) ferredoxin
MEPFRHHVFVCTQQKPEGVTACAASGSFALLETLGKALQEEGLDDEVQVTTCGCMGLCDEGPVMVVYPEGTWYRKLQPGDIGEIARTHLKKGKVVERLEWKDASAMKTLALDHRDKYRAMVKTRDQAGTLPDDLNELIRGYMPSRVVLTALELDVFTAVGSGATAETVGLNARRRARAFSAPHRRTTRNPGCYTLRTSGIAGRISRNRCGRERRSRESHAPKSIRTTSLPQCTATPVKERGW